jgi:ribosome-associated translation inhibitor RaiA
MDVMIRSTLSEVTDCMRSHVFRRAHAALGKYAAEVRVVTLRVRDDNGPRGGVDKQCRLTVELVGGGQLVARATEATFYTAVDHVMRRAAQLLGRALTQRWRAPRVTIARRWQSIGEGAVEHGA